MLFIFYAAVIGVLGYITMFIWGIVQIVLSGKLYETQKLFCTNGCCVLR